MKAPFPWFGGKSRAADLIWARLGDMVNYVEPFAGSLAVLLARSAPGKIETVNDLDCYVANFWRAVAADGEAVARFADHPVNEADLHARHAWLVSRSEWRERMLTDPEHFDARIAGWWVWGLSQWIGSGWCDLSRQLPSLAGDRGAVALSRKLPSLAGDRGAVALSRQLPSLSTQGMGTHGPSRRLPALGGSGSEGERGIANHGKGTHSAANRTRLHDVFAELQARLRYVRVACGDWRRVLSDAVTWRHGTTGILLDPPYPEGTQGLYSADAGGERHVWHDVADWAREHGTDKRLRIALCGYAGTWEPPDGWETVEWKAAGGYAGQSDAENVNATRERIWFSPGCERPMERQLAWC